MKNILVPTDFSPQARAVALCAARLAQHMQARLLLLHVLPLLVLLEEEAAEEKAQGLLDAAAQELYTRSQISITRLLKPGFATDEIPRIAERLQADLIMLGAKGQGNDPDRQVGSVAMGMLQNNTFPVICLPCSGVVGGGEALLWSQSIDVRFCNTKGIFLMQQYRGITSLISP